MKKRIKALVPQTIINILHIFLYRKKKRKTLKLVIDLAKHCNLNCKGCDHFSCIAEERYPDFHTVSRDLNRIKDIFGDKVEQIALLGGEPLLNNQIKDYCELSRNLFPKSKIVILTNGTLLLKKSDDFWECCRKNDIVIRITRYPIKFDYEGVEKFVEEKGIVIEHMARSEIEVKEMYCLPIDLQGKQNPRISYMMCRKGNDCITLEDGKLYTCTMIPNIAIFNNFFNKKLDVTKDDFVDIYENDDPEEILKRLAEPVPFCRYCDNIHFRNGISWGVTKKEIEEWI